MQSMAARSSTMFGATRVSSPNMLVSAPRRAEVIVMAVPKKKMSKSRTNLRYTVWKQAAFAQAEIALMKGRQQKKKDEASPPEASTGVAPAAPAADKK